MADNNIPDGLDDFLTDQDPQSARAGQGLVQAAKYTLDSGPKTADSIEPEGSPIDYLVSGAVSPLTNAMSQGIEKTVGNEIGAIGLDVSHKDVMDSALEHLKNMQNAFTQGAATQNDVAFAQQKLKAAQKIAAREGRTIMGYADGGMIEPDGLDQFLAGSNQQTPPVSVPIGQNQQGSNIQKGMNTISTGDAPAEIDQFLAPELHEEEIQGKYGSPSEQLKTAAESLGQGIAGPLATAGELALGVKPEDIRGREEANPYISESGKIAGLGGSMLFGAGQGRLLLKTGEVASNLIKGAGLASKVGAAAADGAIQNMMLTAGDEMTHAMRNDPDASMQAAVSNIGLSGLLGGSIGGALGTVSPLWKASFGDKAGQVIEDFKNRLDQHMSNPDPVGSVTKELENHWNTTNMIADPVYGSNGLKAQEIASVMPEFKQEMTDQATHLSSKLQDTLEDMAAKPNKYPARFADKINDLSTNLSNSLVKSGSPADLFNAIQDTKNQLQAFSKFDKYVTPVDEGHGFVQLAKQLQHDFRTALEDSAVWGKAANAQKEINAAATDFFKASKDFQSKFTSKIQGEPVIDPGKVATYVNQAGKPNSEIKSTVLKNYLDASDKYRSKISDIHNNLGLTSPVTPTSLNATMQTFDKPTTGSKLADIFIEKGLTQAGGKGIGAAIGAAAGSKVHIPGSELLGTMLGAHILGPFISSVLPLLAKPMATSIASATALKSASDAGYAMIRGNGLVDRATKALFTAARDVIPTSMIPGPAKLAKLDKLVMASQTNLDPMSQGPTEISHYLPEHGAALSNVSGKAVAYLKSIRPNDDPKAPLDNKRVPSKAAMIGYNRQLANAEQPLLILNRIKDGTVTAQDLLTIQTIYPNLYQKMAANLLDQMNTHLSKGKTIPYSVKVGLSKFATEPLDSTMSPSSIISAQPQPKPEVPGNQPGPGKTRKGAGGTALNKLSSQYKTSSQNLAERHQTQD